MTEYAWDFLTFVKAFLDSGPGGVVDPGVVGEETSYGLDGGVVTVPR